MESNFACKLSICSCETFPLGWHAVKDNAQAIATQETMAENFVKCCFIYVLIIFYLKILLRHCNKSDAKILIIYKTTPIGEYFFNEVINTQSTTHHLTKELSHTTKSKKNERADGFSAPYLRVIFFVVEAGFFFEEAEVLSRLRRSVISKGKKCCLDRENVL